MSADDDWTSTGSLSPSQTLRVWDCLAAVSRKSYNQIVCLKEDYECDREFRERCEKNGYDLIKVRITEVLEP